MIDKLIMNILTPIKYVVDNSEFVHINQEKIKLLVKSINIETVKTDTSRWPFRAITFKSIDEAIDFWFIADVMAFCFWGFPKKWTIHYKGQVLDGWWALLASHQNALENGVPILDGKYLADLTLAEVKSIYSGYPEIPLLTERWQILKGIGEILESRFEGKFHHYFRKAPRTALALVKDISATFPGFKDWAGYKGTYIYFYKKAQLLVGDLNHFQKITGIKNLTGEADYKIPALLRGLDLLQYSPQLANLVDSRHELAENSPMEVEIRANMLWVVQLLLKELRPRYPDLTASSLDRILWFMSQDKSLITKPYHLTKTVNY